MRARWDAWLARGVPPGGQPDLVRRVRLGNGLALSLLVIAVVYLVGWVLVGNLPMAWLCAAMSAGAGASIALIGAGQHYLGRVVVVYSGLVTVFAMAVILGPRANYQVILLNGVTLPVVLLTTGEWRTRWATVATTAVMFAALESQALAAWTIPGWSDTFYRLVHANGGLISLFFLGLTVQLLVTENRVAEEHLRRSNEQKSAIVTHMADGLLAVDVNDAIILSNPAFWDLFGLDPGGPATLPGPVAELVERARHGARCAADLTLGGGRFAAASASPIGTSGGVVVMVRDVSVEHAVDRMKTDFAATVSHELRTPLTSLLGFTHLIRKNLERHVVPSVEAGDPRAARATAQALANLEIMQAEGSRLGALIDDVLDLSKMESGRMVWKEDQVEPDQLVTRAVAATAALFASGPVSLEVERGPGAHPALTGDFDRLLQVLINLISNARKFTDAGVVVLGSRVVGRVLELSVRDTGVGIAPGELDRIFERFAQGPEERRKGTGLGLTIAREIARAHGGELTVESTLGRGSTFTLRLPLASTAAS